MGKALDILLGVAGIGAVIGSAYLGTSPDETGFSIMQKAGLSVGTPEAAKYCGEALKVGLVFGAGSLTSLSRLIKYDI